MRVEEAAVFENIAEETFVLHAVFVYIRLRLLANPFRC
jgi:hypothetical protein